MTKIIVLAGQAGHGKDTAADIFVEHGFTRAPLAANLKDMLRTLYASMGFSTDQVQRMTEGDLKETPLASFYGKSPRHLMQTLGTQWGREQVGAKFWLDSWTARFNAGATKPLVVTDCRFENEGTYLKALGAELYLVRRPGFTKNVGAHSSEDLAWAAGAETLWNDCSTAAEFQDSVRARFFS